MDSKKQIVLFDGVCNLCNGFVDFIIKNDKKNDFYFSSLQSESAKKIIAKSDKNVPDLRTVVYVRNGVAHTQSSAALLVFYDLGFPWSTMIIFMIVPKFIRDTIYNYIAKNRYKWFGHKETCRLPSPEEREKFLE